MYRFIILPEVWQTFRCCTFSATLGIFHYLNVSYSDIYVEVPRGFNLHFPDEYIFICLLFFGCQLLWSVSSKSSVEWQYFYNTKCRRDYNILFSNGSSKIISVHTCLHLPQRVWHLIQESLLFLGAESRNLHVPEGKDWNVASRKRVILLKFLLISVPLKSPFFP